MGNRNLRLGVDDREHVTTVNPTHQQSVTFDSDDSIFLIEN